jgi:hypothetical protein
MHNYKFAEDWEGKLDPGRTLSGALRQFRSQGQLPEVKVSELHWARTSPSASTLFTWLLPTHPSGPYLLPESVLPPIPPNTQVKFCPLLLTCSLVSTLEGLFHL